MRAAILWVIGVAMVANGVAMLLVPATWHGLVPGVVSAGPLNSHFVRDIGAAYLVAGGGIVWFLRDRRARAAALAAASFLLAHALIHVTDAIAGRESLAQLLVDAPAVLLPGALVLVLLPEKNGMIKWLLRRRLAAFERSFGYDASYARDILEASPRGFMALARIQAMGRFRRDIPKDVYYAAKLVAVRAEDCGPCTQLVATMAERAGVPAETLRAVLTQDERAMSESVALGVRFTEATLAHDAAADAMREEIFRRWGPRALISLAFAMVSARVFPTIKYALGHGQACTRVTVGGKSVAVLRHAA